MNALTNFLQTNPIVVLVMFLVSLISGLAGLLLGWNQLYQDYLSKSVELPIWLFIVLIFLVPALIIAIRSTRNVSKATQLTQIEGQRFGVQRITLDGMSFERCEFHGSELIFDGCEVFALVRCNLDSFKLTFSKHAATTIMVLTKLYQDPAFRPLVEGMLTNIKDGNHPEAIAPKSPT